MTITDQHIDQAFSELRRTHGGVRNDYYGLLYLEQAFRASREDALLQCTFGGNDYGFDGFHFDVSANNLYLLQFKWTESAALFKESFERLISSGMERVFGNPTQDQRQNQALMQLKHVLLERKGVINCVFIHFVFQGDPAEAERSKALERLREDLESKKFLIDQFFGRSVDLVIEFRSSKTRKIGAQSVATRTHSYPIQLEQFIERKGPGGEVMHIAFAVLADLHAIYLDMGQRFFERNIRASLSEDASPNRAIAKSLKAMILDEKESALAFAFNHNGVTIAAEKLETSDGRFKITEPRLLNGAQTVTTFHRFVQKHAGNPRLTQRGAAVREVCVMCRIITNAKAPFVLEVTINNNRQNPVKPWALHANDMIQLDLADKFQRDLEIYYERQENAFSNLTTEALEEMEISQAKAIELRRLTLTFLASDGELEKLSHLGEVFESEKAYGQVFDRARLLADSRKILLYYKASFRLNRIIGEIVSRGERRYSFVRRARNLVWALMCQAILNDPELENACERFGSRMVIEAGYTDWVAGLAGNKVRMLLSDLVEHEPFATRLAEERFDFLRAGKAFDHCMQTAYVKWKWVVRRLR